MTDPYANIRQALAMGPTPGPWAAHPDIGTPVGTLKIAPPAWGTNTFNVPLIAAVYGTGVTQPANAAFIAACDPDAACKLLEERDALAAENEMLREALKDADNELDWLDEEIDTCDHSVGVCTCSYWDMRRKMKAALAKESSND